MTTLLVSLVFVAGWLGICLAVFGLFSWLSDKYFGEDE